MQYQFFFSYARDTIDNDSLLSRFFDDLCKEVRGLKNPPPPMNEIGFRDTTSIKLGAEWTPVIKQALQTSLSLVYVLSPNFFYREFCGKEFHIFCERLKLDTSEIAARRAQTPVLLPVLWIPIKGWMPEELKKHQWLNDSLPTKYRTYGFRQLMRLSKFRDVYKEFVTLFANMVIAAAEGPPLQPLAVVPDIGDVPNAFKAPVAPATAAGAGSKTTIADEDPGGPNEVKFVFAVASRAEIKTVRNNSECYHDQEGYWWRPYRPDDEKSIGMIAQEVSSQEQIRYRELRLSKGIANELKNAHKRKQIVIILVDAWTLQLETYRARVNQCDTVSLPNCAVLIPWNEKDIETCQHEVNLDATMKVTLPTKVLSAGPPYFHARVRSAKELREGLRKTLVEIKMNLLSLGEVEKAIAGSPLPVPTLPVPGGEGR